ncbi:cell division protein FtsH, partial [Acinetobacter baumannii]
IIIAMAGRAAQEHYLGVVDSGARGDLVQGTKLARLMVMSWGMSNVGHISVGQQSDGSQITIGPDLQNRIDAEFCRIVEECWDASVKLVA